MGHVLFSEHCSQILTFLSPVPCGLLCVLGAPLHGWLRPQMLSHRLQGQEGEATRDLTVVLEHVGCASQRREVGASLHGKCGW